MELLNKTKNNNILVSNTTPMVRCKAFEENCGALEIAMSHKCRHNNKHLNNKLHHVIHYGHRKESVILPIKFEDQLVDYLAKSVDIQILQTLRILVMGC